MSGPTPQEKAIALKVAVSALTSFAIMIVDFVWLMRDEVKYVWPRLRTSWHAKFYVFARYIGLPSQIYNVFFTVRMYLGVETSPLGCRFWFIYQAIIVQLLLLTAEGLLMHRIAALYFRDRFIVAVLFTFALAQVASMWVSTRLSFPSNQHTVTCLMVKGNPGNAFFSTTTMTTHIIAFFMTFYKYWDLPVSWTHGTFGRIVLRDSVYSLGAITLIMLFMTLCSLGVFTHPMSSNLTFYWFLTVLWVSIGRVIVDHEKIPRDETGQEEDSAWRASLQLTSLIEMGELSPASLRGSSDGHTATSRTLGSQILAPILSPISATCAGDSPQKSLEGRSASSGGENRHGSQPLDTVTSAEISLSLPNVTIYESEGDAPQPEADAGDGPHSFPSSSRLPSPELPSSEPTPSEVTS